MQRVIRVNKLFEILKGSFLWNESPISGILGLFKELVRELLNLCNLVGNEKISESISSSQEVAKFYEPPFGFSWKYFPSNLENSDVL